MNIESQLQKTQDASRKLVRMDDTTINRVLLALADKALEMADHILAENAKDLARMDRNDPKYDRLALSRSRLEGIAADIRNVASLPSPLGRVIEEFKRPNGMRISKVSVPFGVIGIIYEARPNVTFDVFSLCLKSGNACVLKGGSDAADSNRAIMEIIRQTLVENGLDPDTACLLPADRQATAEMLSAVGYIDLVIPRGSAGLIRFVRDNSRIPVIETGAGVCHTYFHDKGDLEKGRRIVNNAKTRRVSVCNTLDTLIVDESRLRDLPELCRLLPESRVIVYADSQAYEALKNGYPQEWLRKASPEHFGTEFMDYKMAIKTVSGLDQALEHIRKCSSKHSESIITEDRTAADRFLKEVDAACVYHNVSTAFTDGAQFGMGAEIGISTQKMHARGPMALREMTSYKWIIEGDGQIRIP